MMRIVLAIAVVTLTVVRLAAPAHAEDWSRDDWLYGSLAAGAGGAGGALVGGLAGSLLDTCGPADRACIPASTIAGAGAGLLLGSAAGVTLYGKRRGHDGSFGRAVIGALLGNLAAGPVVVLAAHTIDEPALGLPIVIGTLVAFPAIGATIGYQRSIGGGGDSTPGSGALLDVTPEHAQLQVPAVGLSITAHETVVLVPLAGGTF
jgi:hypothetical protein